MKTTPTPIHLSQVGEQLGRLFTKLAEPGGSILWEKLNYLLDQDYSNDHPSMVLGAVSAEQGIKGKEFSFSFNDCDKSCLITEVKKTVKIKDWASDLIQKNTHFAIEKIEGKRTFLAVSLADLGFKEKTSLPEVLTRAKKLGLNYCPDRTALEYCLHSPAILKADRIFFASVPARIPKRDLKDHILRLSKGELDAVRVFSDRYLVPGDLIIFLKG